MNIEHSRGRVNIRINIFRFPQGIFLIYKQKRVVMKDLCEVHCSRGSYVTFLPYCTCLLDFL